MTTRRQTANDDTLFWTLKVLQENPDVTQPTLAKEVGINVSTINFCLKALFENGWIKMGTRLEQLGWLASADEWLTLRQVRNQFAHDYPDSAAERFERLQAATQAASQLLEVMMNFQTKLASNPRQ
jgi:DNA-binding Lrp family transcriptional regulator